MIQNYPDACLGMVLDHFFLHSNYAELYSAKDQISRSDSVQFNAHTYCYDMKDEMDLSIYRSEVK